jgi:membrane-associated phospholipid phosphatase
MEYMKEIFDKTGTYLPLLMIFINILLMQKKPYYQYYFVLFTILNSLLNPLLKQIIKQPRPSVDEKTFQAMMKKNERYIRRHGFPYDIFGMPSGHAQSALFSTVYNFMVFRNFRMTAVFVGLSLITIGQRVVFHHHTVAQVLIGALVGSGFAYLIMEYVVKRNVGGKFSFKKDDNASP